MTNCLNCGAPINWENHIKCPYCGTEYYDFANIDMNEPFYIKIKDGVRMFIARVICSDATVAQHPAPLTEYKSIRDSVYMCESMPDIDINVNFRVVYNIDKTKPSIIRM